MHDEPYSVSDRARRHLDACPRCHSRFEQIGETATKAASLLAGGRLDVDEAAALARVRRAAGDRQLKPRPWARLVAALELRRTATLRWSGAAALTAALLATALVSGAAQGLVTIFEPKQFAPVPVTQSQIASLPDLSAYGTEQWTKQPQTHEVATAAEATSLTGLQVPVPSKLPASVPTGSIRYEAVDQGSASFTFSAAKAREAAAKQGKQLPAMPPNIDGSTLYVTAGPAVAAVYGSPGTGTADTQNLPALVVAVSKAPVVSSTGVSVDELENYLLQQPGVSPELAQAIRAIGKPSTGVVPVPIPVQQFNSRQAQVQGVSALVIGDRTGIGSGVLWQKNDKVYAVAGPLRDDEVVSIADSLG
jgi:hypothetical protein